MSTFITVLPVILAKYHFLSFQKILEHQFPTPKNISALVLFKTEDQRFSSPKNRIAPVLFETEDHQFPSTENSSAQILFKSLRHSSQNRRAYTAYVREDNGLSPIYRRICYCICYLCYGPLIFSPAYLNTLTITV